MGIPTGISDLLAQISTLILRKITQKWFWDTVGNFEGLPHWKQLTIQALALFGSEDTNVPPAANRNTLEALHKDNISVIMYQGFGKAREDPPGQGNCLFL